jgi:hypothetical protein
MTPHMRVLVLEPPEQDLNPVSRVYRSVEFKRSDLCAFRDCGSGVTQMWRAGPTVPTPAPGLGWSVPFAKGRGLCAPEDAAPAAAV